MIYAPVAIATLNRYEHFKKCIESLDRCNGSHETDVYIALDYPPSPEYFEGYEKIKSYLASSSFSFKSFNVFVREKNYGVGPKGNLIDLLDNTIFKKYDRVIISEDDNIFAKTFLQFMNGGLEVCEKRNDVVLVGGYSIPVKWHNDGSDIVLLNSNANAWGYGILRSHYKEMYDIDVQEYYHRLLSSRQRKNHILNGSSNDDGAMAWYILDGTQNHNDTFKSIFIRDTGKFFLCPKVSKVFNIGSDGSGLHSGKKDTYGFNNTKLDQSDELDFSIFDSVPEYHQETMNIINSFFHIPIVKKAFIRFVFATHNFWKKHRKLGLFIKRTYIKMNPRL